MKSISAKSFVVCISLIESIMNNELGKATGLLPVSPKGQLTTVWGEIKTNLY